MSSLSSATHTDQYEKRWYTRRDGVMRGPFSAENISSYLLLGRIRLDDELSQDCVSWSVARHLAKLLPDELASQSCWDDYERLVIAHMKADERGNERRRTNHKGYLDTHAERRKIPDRRVGGGNTMLSRYLFAGALSYEEKRPDSRRLRVLLLTMLLASLLFAWLNPIQQ